MSRHTGGGGLKLAKKVSRIIFYENGLPRKGVDRIKKASSALVLLL